MKPGRPTILTLLLCVCGAVACFCGLFMIQANFVIGRFEPIYLAMPTVAGTVVGTLAAIVLALRQRLMESAQRFRALVDTAPSMAILRGTDGRVLFASPACAEVTGHDLSSFLSDPGFLDRLIQPEWRDAWRRNLTRAQSGYVSLEAELRHRKGHAIWVNGHAEPVRNGEGTKDGLRVVLWDVTERRRAAEERDRAEAVLKAMTEALPVLISYVDADLVIRFANSRHEEWLARPLDRIVGRNMKELMGDDVQFARTAPPMYEAIAGKPVELETTERFPDGKERRILVRYAPRRMPDGTIAGFFALVEDVTERAATEAKLRQAQKLEVVGQMTGGMAHDFNNLLAVVIGNLDLVEADPALRPELRRLVHAASAAAERGVTLNARLLAFARRQALQPQSVDAAALVDGMRGLLQQSLGAAVTLEVSAASGLWRCLIDPSQLEAALLNLAVNARDAMAGGGVFTIALANVDLTDRDSGLPADARPGRYVMVAATDTGLGMPADVKARAFDPFFTTKDVGKGTGLGLSMVHGFARQSNGHVTIDSAPGCGTTVRLFLPRADEAPVSAPAATRDAQAPEARHQETVLVVEDDAAVREYVTTCLGSLGYRSFAVADARAAKAVLAENRDIDLLLTDVVLPDGISGIALASDVRRTRPGLKILLTSGYTPDSMLREGRDLGSVEFLPKPYRRAQLAERLDRLLGGP